MDNRLFGKRIKEVRSQQNLTCEQLSEKAQLSTSFLRHVELGDQGISLETLVKISNALSICPSNLLLDDSLKEDNTFLNLILQQDVYTLTDNQIHLITLTFEALIKDFRKGTLQVEY